MTILAVTLNTAIDLTTDTGKVESGDKHRCGPVRLDLGGGGVSVSRAIPKLGKPIAMAFLSWQSGVTTTGART